jgi:hypothetical protein
MNPGWFGPAAQGVFRGWPSAAPRTPEGWIATGVFVGILTWAAAGWGLDPPAQWGLGMVDVVAFLALIRATFVDDGNVY